MRTITSTITQRLRQVVTLLVAIVIGLVFTLTSMHSHAASGSGTLFISPSRSTNTVGDVVTFTVEENSGATAVNGVQANLTYSASNLQYDSYSVANSNFNYPGPSPTISPGVFQFAMLSTSPLMNNENVFTISFTVIGSGTGTIGFASSAAVATTTGANEGATTTGATLTLNAAVTAPVTPPVAPPTKPIPTTPLPPVVAPKSPVASPSSTSTTITPSGSTTSVAVPNNSNVKITAPATVQPTVTASTTAATTTTASSPNGTASSSQTSVTPADPVVKVQYFLSKKLLATEITAPFTYSLQTRNILNGKYNFITKSYYASGKTSTSEQKLDVANPESITQIKLAAQQYSVPSGLTLLAIVIVVLIISYRRRLAYYLQSRNKQQFATAETTIKPIDVGPIAHAEVIPPSATPHVDISSIPTPVQKPGSVYGPSEKHDDDQHLQ